MQLCHLVANVRRFLLFLLTLETLLTLGLSSLGLLTQAPQLFHLPLFGIIGNLRWCLRADRSRCHAAHDRWLLLCKVWLAAPRLGRLNRRWDNMISRLSSDGSLHSSRSLVLALLNAICCCRLLSNLNSSLHLLLCFVNPLLKDGLLLFQSSIFLRSIANLLLFILGLFVSFLFLISEQVLIQTLLHCFNFDVFIIAILFKGLPCSCHLLFRT